MKMLQKAKKTTYRLLRKSEKFFRTDMVYLAKGGGWLSLGKGFQSVAGLLLAVAFANLVAPDIYGTYKYVVALGALIGAFTLSNMMTAVTQATARGYDGALRKGFWLSLKWSVGIIVIALGAGVYYFLGDNTTLAVAMLLIAISQPFIQSAQVYQGFLEGKKDFQRRSIYLIIWEAVEVGALLLTLLFTDNILIILTVFFAGNAVPMLFFYLRTLDIYQPSDESPDNLERYGGHLSIMKLLGELGDHLDKILIFHFLGAAEVAIYTLALLPGQKFASLLSTIQPIALPKFSNTDPETLKATLPRKVGLFFIFITAVAGFLAFIFPFLYSVLFSQYPESVTYAQVYLLSLLALPASFFGQALTSQQKTKSLYGIVICANILKIIFLLVLLPVYGLWGAIAALLMAMLIQALLNTIYFLKM